MYLKLTFFIIVISISTCSHNGEFHNEAVPSSGAEKPKDSPTNVPQRQAEHSCPYIRCDQLNHPCISCSMNETCVYGDQTIAKCKALHRCIGNENFERPFICQYCYQTELWEHTCVQKANCDSVASPRASYRTNCTVHDDVICLGRRTFLRKLTCNWTGGHRWSTAMLLSVTLGGFGADRFYLGYWQEGIGKLFSFGGLGVWTIIDFILISIQYLGPADGSLYI